MKLKDITKGIDDSGIYTFIPQFGTFKLTQFNNMYEFWTALYQEAYQNGIRTGEKNKVDQIKSILDIDQ